jgi:hypothetical protein
MQYIKSLHLLIALIILNTCANELQSSEISSEDSNHINLEQRVQIAKEKYESDDFTRWDSPWWEMSNEEIADSLRVANGKVIISFREPDKIAGVDIQGNIKVSNQTISNAIEAIIDLGVEVKHEYLLHPSVLAKIPVGLELISRLRNHPLVDIFEPSMKVKFENIQPNEITWNIERVNAPNVWSETTGKNVKLLVIDTGIDNNHDSLDPAVIQACDGSNGIDQDGHGTGVSGVAAALLNGQDVVGVAHEVSLWSSKISNSTQAKCAVEFGRVNNVDVINISWGLTPSSSLTDQINAAYNQDDIVIVKSAGNTSGGSVTYPANLSTTIAVTATDINNNVWSGAAQGPEIELAAPGVNIETTKLGGGTRFATGTSYAAPHVAGAAALLRSYNPNWSNDEIRTRMNETAQKIPGSPHEIGNGLLDVEAALYYIPPPQTPPAPSITLDASGMNPKLNWNAVSGADSYNIYYGSIQGAPGNVSCSMVWDYSYIANTTSTTYTDDVVFLDPNANTLACYYVTSVNEIG